MRSSDFLFMTPAVGQRCVDGTHISNPRVVTCLGLGQATGFDSPVGDPAFYVFAVALDVRSRASNPRPISLTPCHPTPERLSACDLAISPAHPPCAHAQWLTQYAY